MEVFTPSEAESVKLLTIHRAKGLEWNTVFVPLMSATVFPSGQGRANWITTCVGRAHRAARRPVEPAADGRRPEDWTDDVPHASTTRATRSSGTWRSGGWPTSPTPAPRNAWSCRGTGGVAPRTSRAARRSSCSRPVQWLIEHGGDATTWAPEPAAGATNPHLGHRAAFRLAGGAAGPGPPPRPGRRRPRDAWTDPTARPIDVPLLPADRLDELCADIELLLAEADAVAAQERVVTLPGSVSTTVDAGAGRGRGDVRPRARPADAAPPVPGGAVRHPVPRLGRGALRPAGAARPQPSCPAGATSTSTSDAELDEVIETFRRAPTATANPYAIEAPFSLVLGGQQVIGRIDAVFQTRRRLRGGRLEDQQAAPRPTRCSSRSTGWPGPSCTASTPRTSTGAFYYVRLGEVASGSTTCPAAPSSSGGSD